MRSATAILLALAVAAAGATAELRAQIPADRSYLEFTSSIRIPGATLAPGMYLFVIGRHVGGQAILDVYSADGARHLATCLTIESTLPRPSAATTLDFPKTTPPALRAWFHPANARGLEFVYGQSEAKALFRASGQRVPYAAFKPANRDLVGAFPIGTVTPLPLLGVASPAVMAPSAAGTSGMTALFEPFEETIGPHEHLTSARRVIAAAAAKAVPTHKAMLQTLGRQVSQLQSAYRRGDRKDTTEILRLVDTAIENMMPTEVDIAAHRRVRMPWSVVVVIERVQAHVRAFEKAAAAPARAGR